MNTEEKAKIILQAVDSVYSVPTYMEKYVIKAVISGLLKIEKQEGREKHEINIHGR